MTGLLHDVMHERADSLEPPLLDVAAMVREGDRRRVRSRRTYAGGLVAASLVVASAWALPGGGGGDGRRTDSAAVVHSYDVAYALGSTIHDGTRTVETELEIVALVQGVSGYVVGDAQGRVHTVLDGETRQVGRLVALDPPRIVGDGDVVAWVDAADEGTLSVLDLATGDRVDVRLGDWPGEALNMDTAAVGVEPVSIAAVDGRTVYVTDTRGVMAWDALDGEEPVLLAGPPGVQVRDVQEGQILHVVSTFEPEERGGRSVMVAVTEQRVGRDLEDARRVPGVGGVLSPDGRSLAYVQRHSEQGLSVYTTAVGDIGGDSWTPASSDGNDSVSVYRWLDADTFAAHATTVTEDGLAAALLVCETGASDDGVDDDKPTMHGCTTVRPYEDGMVLPTSQVP